MPFPLIFIMWFYRSKDHEDGLKQDALKSVGQIAIVTEFMIINALEIFDDDGYFIIIIFTVFICLTF